MAAKRSQTRRGEMPRRRGGRPRRRVVDGVVGDGREPAVAAVDDAAVGVSLAARRRARRLGDRAARRERGRLAGRGAVGSRPAISPSSSAQRAGVDERQRVERHVERRLAERPVVGLAGVGMDAEGDELLAEAEDLDAAGRASSRTVPSVR